MAETRGNIDTKQSKLKTIWFFLRPYKGHVFALFVLAGLIGMLETTTVAAIYPVVSLGLDVQAGQGNILLALIARVTAMSPLKDEFISYCVLVIILAVMDPRMHSSQEVRTVLDLFDGEINIFRKKDNSHTHRFLRIQRMRDQEYSDSELPLSKEDQQRAR